jgi:hypothetical protein
MNQCNEAAPSGAPPRFRLETPCAYAQVGRKAYSVGKVIWMLISLDVSMGSAVFST